MDFILILFPAYVLLLLNVCAFMVLDEPESQSGNPPRPLVREGLYPLVLVSYDTLIHNGTRVFSKEGVDTFSAVTVVNDDRLEEKGVYVGARNWLIKFNSKFRATDTIEIAPSANEINTCKGSRPAKTCHNFVKYIYVNQAAAMSRIEVCGTFAWQPMCSERMVNTLAQEKVRLGGLVPGNPSGSVAPYISKDKLFVGLSDPDSKFARIYTTTLSRHNSIRSERDWLNEAEVVGAFSPSSTDKFVYHVFREKAIESPSGNEIYSRVARICKDDIGGQKPDITGLYVSFTKATLNCSSQYPLVQSISYVEGDPYFWATFTAGERDGGAICGFRLSELYDVFQGPPRNLRSGPIIKGDDTLVTTCYGKRTVGAMRNNVLMNKSISSSCDDVFTADAKLMKMAVSSKGQDGFIAFAGDDQGRVWKVKFKNPCKRLGDVQLWEVVPQIQRFPKEPTAITGLADNNGFIIVLTHKAVMKILVEDYPGRIISAPVTVKSHPTEDRRKRSPLPHELDSGSKFEFSCSQLAIPLIVTAVISN